jgi:hypothetical protein
MIKFLIISTIIVSIITFLVILLQSLIWLILLLVNVYILQFFNVRTNFKRATRLYETLSRYHSDEVLRNYPFLEVITNKHFIHFDTYNQNYPLWFNHDISHVYEFRNEFRFFNIEKLTDICRNIKPKEEQYDLGLYFDLPEYKIFGDDAPNQWLKELTEREFRDILNLLSKLTPRAKITYLFESQKELENI